MSHHLGLVWILVLLAAILAVAPQPAAAGRKGAGKVVIREVRPALVDSLLVCSLITQGLPDRPTRETLASGMPSALVVGFTLLDASGREVARSSVEVRLEPDLWEGGFLMRTPLLDQKLPTLEEVGARLEQLGPLPVLPAGQLQEGEWYRVRSRLAVFPLAPAEASRVRAFLQGEMRTDERERREVSFGLGSLFRYFLGSGQEEDWIAEFLSGMFQRQTLPGLDSAVPGASSPEEVRP